MKKIAVTIGDPSGIGPEIVLKALVQNPQIYENCVPIVFGHAAILEAQKRISSIDVHIRQLDDIATLPEVSENHIVCYSENKLKELPETGTINARSGALSFEYIRMAIEQANLGQIDAVATAPINKEALKLAGVPFGDHTAMFSKLTNSSKTMTLFVTGNLRIFFLTRHIAFREISSALSEKQIVSALHNCHHYLKQIGIKEPRLAVAALNPHGGEHGLFGDEEQNIISPAVQKSQAEGLSVTGPVPADSVFQLCKEGYYDGVLSLYHDQGHIAAKTLDFYGTVSLTMGLPFLRTSVDHGTALEIAGQNKANPTSMTKAIEAAIHYMWP